MNSKPEDRKTKGLPNPLMSVGNSGTPWSERFSDTYFDRDNGLEESRHVFLNGCDLLNQWTGQQKFVIGETGFGTGLNFLAAWDLWRRTETRPSVLHYLSVEGFPLTAGQIDDCLDQWPELRALKTKLVGSYPHLQQGMHRVFFDENQVVLTLIFDDVEPALRGLDVKADAWFFDGFSPSTNKDMWRPNVFNEVARLSKPGAKIATFTVAGDVRRSLTATGFQVEKRSGVGNKKEIMSGYFAGPAPKSPVEPWFAAPPEVKGISPRVAIVGAGLAGTNAAYAFARRRCHVTLIDQDPEPASEASSVPAAIVMPRLTAGTSTDGSFFATAWQHCLQLIEGLEDAQNIAAFTPCGVLQIGRSEKDAARMQTVWESGVLAPDDVQFLEIKEASAVAGISVSHGGLYFPRGGWINTSELCKYLADAAHQTRQSVVALCQRENDHWILYDRNQAKVIEADIVVLANGLAACTFSQTHQLPLTPRLGQLTRFKATEQSGRLACVLVSDGHVTPLINDRHICGATFDHIEAGSLRGQIPAPSQDADERNLAMVHELLPGDFEPEQCDSDQSWVGVRCTTPDHLPIAGPVPDIDAYVRDYGDIRHGRHWVDYPDAQYHEGLYVLTGLGARGVVTAPLAAEVIASQALGDPLPISNSLVGAVHPGRFAVRSLKRGDIASRNELTSAD